MTTKIAMDNYYVILYSMSAVVISLFICFYIYLRAKKTMLLNLYLLTQLMLILWSFSKALKTVAPNIYMRWLFIVTQYFGISFIGLFFFLFAYTYSTGKLMQTKHVTILSILPFASFIIILTNPLHMKFYSFFDMYKDSFGPLFYVHQFIVYSYLLAGIILCSKGFKKQFGERRVQAVLFTVAILLPLVVNTLYVFKILKLLFNIRLPMDITPISCLVSLFLFTVAALKYRFLDITPLAYEKALEQAYDAIILVNTSGVIIEYNKALFNIFNTFCRLEQEDKAYNFFCDIEKYVLTGDAIKVFNSAQNGSYCSEDITIRLDAVSHFKIVAEPVTDTKGKLAGTLFRFIECTTFKRLIDEVYNKNLQLSIANVNLEQRAEILRQLAATRVRNIMAKEVHDIIGHSVVLVISMLEVTLIDLRKGKKVEEYIDNAIRILKDGLEEIKNSIRENKTSQPENFGLLKSIDLMSEQIKALGIGMEITLQGEPFELTSIQIENIYKICREAVTNAIRHGNADLINIIFRFSTNRFSMYIIDNGGGCITFKKGMGLSGIEERAEEIGGTVSYNSYIGEGFSIQLTLKT